MKNHLPYVYFEQFHFQTKKHQLFENQMLDKGGGKCQLLDTIYSKENGVHVRQLGQVRLGVQYMYGSQVRCQVRLGQVRLGQARLGQVRLGQVRLGQVRFGQVRLGQVRLGQVRNQVRQGSFGLEQVRQIKLLTISIRKKFTFSVYMSHQKEVFLSFARIRFSQD